MDAQPSHSIPEGWVELERLELTATVAAPLTGGSILIGMLASGLFTALADWLGAPLSSWGRWGWAAVLLGVAVAFPLHEWLHGVAFRCFGGRPRYGVGMAGFLPYFFATAAGLYRRNQFLAIGLAPLVLGTLLGTIALLIPGLGPVAVTFLIVNASGAVGDIWSAWRVLQYPPDVLCRDAQSYVAFFGPPELRRPPKRAATGGADLLGAVGFGVLAAIPLVLAVWVGLDLLIPADRPGTLTLPGGGLPPMFSFTREAGGGGTFTAHISGLAVAVVVMTGVRWFWIRRRR